MKMSFDQKNELNKYSCNAANNFYNDYVASKATFPEVWYTAQHWVQASKEIADRIASFPSKPFQINFLQHLSDLTVVNNQLEICCAIEKAMWEI